MADPTLTREYGVAGLNALRRFFSELPHAAREWPKQAYELVRLPADLVMGGSPEEKRLERQYAGDTLRPLPAATRAQQTRKGSPERAAHNVAEFANPIANAMFAPKQAMALAASPVGQATLGGLAALMTGAGPVATPAMMAGVVKGKGGNWLSGSVEDALKPLVPKAGAMDRSANSVMEEMLRTYPADKLEMMSPDTRATVDAAFARLRPQVAVQNWIEGPLTKYVKTRMASPEDEVRKLAEQGVLHVQPDMARLRDMTGRRNLAGFPAQPPLEGHTAQYWNNQADAAVRTQAARDLYPQERTASFGGKSDIDPETRVHSIDDMSGLGFPHLIDELSNALNPNSGLPRNLLLTPEAVQQMSMEKAVRRVADINAWRAAQKIEANRKLAEQASLVRDYPHSEATPNPKGLRWVELKAPQLTDAQYLATPGENPSRSLLEKQLKYEGDTMGHCVGGYCDDVLSGRSRIFSLRDAKGEPHVTVEVSPEQRKAMDKWAVREALTPEEATKYFAASDLPGVHDYESQLKAAGLYDVVADRLGYNKPLGQTIKQIKGKQNRAPNEEYLPFVQDFVRNSPLGSPWSEVGDLQSAALRKHPNEPRYLTDAEYSQLLDTQSPGMADGGPVQNPLPADTNSGYNSPDIPELWASFFDQE